MSLKVQIEDIKSAQQRIKSFINITPCDFSRSASELLDTEVYFKLENLQKTGSFKIRGATNKISQLSDEDKKRGVIACSAGNHAQGVALSSRLNNVQATIVMPQTAPIAKVNATRGYGAQIIQFGQTFDEAKSHALELAAEKKYLFISPYEDQHVIAGQGTIGLELLEQIVGLDSVIIPVGGGGLISGISVALKSLNPKIKIYGVQSSQVSTMAQLFQKGVYEKISGVVQTIADGIAVKEPSPLIFQNFISKYVDEMTTVSDDQIAEAVVFLLERAKTVAEGSGAASLAAAFRKKWDLGQKTCILISGGNIDLNIISDIIRVGQLQRGRLCEFTVVVPDIPGSLNLMTKILAEQKANVLEVNHLRFEKNLSLKETKIHFVLETASHEHILQIRKALEKSGARFED